MSRGRRGRSDVWRGGTLQCDMLCTYSRPLWADRHLWKHYLHATSFAGSNEPCQWGDEGPFTHSVSIPVSVRDRSYLTTMMCFFCRHVWTVTLVTMQTISDDTLTMSTSMHSSRMCTARLLTISCSARGVGDDYPTPWMHTPPVQNPLHPGYRPLLPILPLDADPLHPGCRPSPSWMQTSPRCRPPDHVTCDPLPREQTDMCKKNYLAPNFVCGW